MNYDITFCEGKVCQRKGGTSAAWWIDNRYDINNVAGVPEDLNNIIKKIIYNHDE